MFTGPISFREHSNRDMIFPFMTYAAQATTAFSSIHSSSYMAANHVPRSTLFCRIARSLLNSAVFLKSPSMPKSAVSWPARSLWTNKPFKKFAMTAISLCRLTPLAPTSGSDYPSTSLASTQSFLQSTTALTASSSAHLPSPTSLNPSNLPPISAV